MAGDTPGAIVLLTEAIRKDPGNNPGGYGYGPVNKLPEPDRETTMGRSLTGQLTFADLAAATEGIDALQVNHRTL
jgi:hypothetical protein